MIQIQIQLLITFYQSHRGELIRLGYGTGRKEGGRILEREGGVRGREELEEGQGEKGEEKENRRESKGGEVGMKHGEGRWR